MKSKLHVVRGREAEEVSGVQLPEHVQLSLAGIAGQAKDGLLALAVSTGLAVLHETMEWEVERIVGPKGRHDARAHRQASRPHRGEVTLGGSPGADQPAAGSDRGRHRGDRAGQLPGVRLTAICSSRSCWSGCSPASRPDGRVGWMSRSASRCETEARSTSKSAVSRSFVARTRTALEELLGRDLSDLELAVVMIDGIDLADVTHVVALGITTDGTKVPLSLREGSTENATVATALLVRPRRPRAAALRGAAVSCWTARRRCARRCATSPATRALVQRCRHPQVPQRVRSPARAGARRGCAPSSARRGATPTTTTRSPRSRRSPPSWPRCIPTPPDRCGRGWRRRSP